ncbi:alpha/beta fold hydrolase [Marinigracilibium pacificum]|uniref:Alpha/beta fold hydrolase n=1 Tax=Marinigracilibium pacificum TaxID=2729599 RepID=A0A848J2F8_9BACT|nr:alpha/beta hydrolase [Marinigracilibium pacificum]NMM47372.1 alpha/beta fold hydrolase [Marinigracilibium pacificum]
MNRFFLQIQLFLFLVPFIGFSQKSEGYINYKNSDIYYQSYGKGQPLLIINGGPGMNSRGFEGLAQELGKKYYTILFDQRGTGNSKLTNISSETISMDLMVEDIEDIRKKLNIESWTILGQSFGGILANYYAVKYPEKVSGLIHSSSAGINLDFLQQNGIESSLTPTEIDSLNYWRAQSKETGSEESDYMSRFYLAKAYLHGNKYEHAIAERLGQANMQINSIVWSELRESNYDLSKELSSFDKPVLILQGEFDVLKPDVAYKLKDVFKNSTVSIIKGSGHYGWLENPNDYFEVIDSFMTELKRK